jgi:predicted GTPase
MKRNVLIMGAGGRDFHTFNMIYRDNPNYNVRCITATQIPDIEGRIYPPSLSGPLYPEGIPIESEDRVEELVRELDIDEVVFAYSDVSYDYVRDRGAVVMAAGAQFSLPSPAKTMVKAAVPVVAVCAIRTGCGKSQTSRRVIEILRAQGKRVVAIRHPMPYGDLDKQGVQRFETVEDLRKHECTIEEMEEYEPHIDQGTIVYAGADYEAIVRQAEKEADVIIWDGGNNDTSFIKPDLYITVVDPHRAGHELTYYPGRLNFLLADAIVINKMDSAKDADVAQLESTIAQFNPNATVVKADSPVSVDDESIIRGKRVLVVEDGPTLTHGEMTFGAGCLAAERFGAAEMIDPRQYAVGTIKEMFEKYPGTGKLLPAVGYGDQQVADLEQTINACDCDAVVVATPIDLARIIKIDKPSVRVEYKLEELGDASVENLLSGI